MYKSKIERHRMVTLCWYIKQGDIRDVVVTIRGNGYGNTSSNLGNGSLHFT